MLYIILVVTLVATNDSDVGRTDSGFGTKMVNTQIYSFVEYHEQTIDIYKSNLLLRTNYISKEEIKDELDLDFGQWRITYKCDVW